MKKKSKKAKGSKKGSATRPSNYETTPKEELLRKHSDRLMECTVEGAEDAQAEDRLFAALNSGNTKKVKQFLDFGLNLGIKVFGQSMLEIAEAKGHRPLIKLLKERGAKE